jgi:hypothetical protein
MLKYGIQRKCIRGESVTSMFGVEDVYLEADFSEMLVTFCQTTRRHVPEDSVLHIHNNKKLRYYKLSLHCRFSPANSTKKKANEFSKFLHLCPYTENVFLSPGIGALTICNSAESDEC